MAQIRSEAVQARKLAEQIDNMSQNVPTRTRKQVVMTDSTTIDSGKTGEKQRRASDKPRTAKVRSTFNPLHPSMELPPEQLIRLLGLESKKIRKHKRAQTSPEHETAAPSDASTLPPELKRSATKPAIKESPAARSTHRQREYERARDHGDSKSRHGLWLPSLTIGLICGIAGSFYLFWMQPERGATNKAPTSVTSTVNRSQVSGTLQKPSTQKTASNAKPKPAPAAKDDPAWLATVEARRKPLREEAEQRFEQRLKQATQAEVVTTGKPEEVTSDEPALVTTGESEVTITNEPAMEPETTDHEGTLAEDTDISTASQLTKPVGTSLQVPVTPDIGDGRTIEFNEEQVPAATTEPTSKLSGGNILPTPAPDAPSQEGTAELF